MRFDELNEDNYMMFAIKHYENPQAVTQEDFYEDLKKFKYIKRLLKRYQKSGELKSHLLLNHFICLYNVFDDAATPHQGWVGVTTYLDMHGTLRVKSEVLVAMSGIDTNKSTIGNTPSLAYPTVDKNS